MKLQWNSAVRIKNTLKEFLAPLTISAKLKLKDSVHILLVISKALNMMYLNICHLNNFKR